ncbi:hypothetical protein Tco_0981814 [Tanacetum coccineum]
MAGVSERCIGCDARGLIRWNLSWGERGGWNQRRGGEESGDDESKLRWSTVVDVDESGLRQKLLRQVTLWWRFTVLVLLSVINICVVK